MDVDIGGHLPRIMIKPKLNAARMLLALSAFLIGLTIMADWMFSNAVIQVNSIWKPAQFNAALCIVLTALAIFLIRIKPILSKLFVGFVFILSLLTLMEYLFHLNLGIDQLFLKPGQSFSDAEFPGRMAPNTSVCFVLLSLSVLIHLKWQNKLAKFAQLTFAILVFGLAAIALLGYFLGIGFAYGWSTFTAMAIFTACAMIALSVSLMIYYYYNNQAFYSKHGLTQTMSIIVCGALFFVLLWQLLVSSYLQQIQKNTQDNLNTLMKETYLAVNDNYLASQRFLKRLVNKRLYQSDIVKDADAYLNDMPNLVVVLWEEPGQPMEIKTRPLFSFDLQSVMSSCQQGYEQQTVKTSIFKQDERSYLCVYIQGYRSGFLLFNLENTIENAIYKSQLINTSLTVHYQNDLLFAKTSPVSTHYLQKWALQEPLQFDFMKFPFQFKIWPTREYIEGYIPWFLTFFFWLGIITTFLLAYINHLKQKLAVHNLELQSSLSSKNTRLVEIESKYQRIYDFSPDLYLFVNTDSIIVECNQTFVDAMGFFRKKGVVGHELFSRLKVPDREKRDIIKSQLANSGYLSNLELNLEMADGRVCPMMLKITPFLNHNQQLLGYLFSFRDISDIRKLKSELAVREYSVNLFKENKALYDLVLNETTDGWWDINLETNECYLSPQLLISLGFKKNLKPTVTFFRDTIIPDDWPILEQNLKKHIQSKGKHPLKQIIRYKHANGEIMWIYCRGQGIVDPDGKIRRIVGTHVDITPLKVTQAKLSKKVRELDLIAQITHLIAISEERESLFNQCLSSIALATSFNHGICYCYDETNNCMKIVTYWSKTDKKSINFNNKASLDSFGEGLVGTCWAEEKTHSLSHQLNVPNPLWPNNQFKSSLVFPIIIFNKVSMIFQFFSTDKDNIEHDDVSMFELLANQMGLAFEKMKTHYLLQQLALNDELTTLPNRRACIERLERTLQRASQLNTRFGLMFLDLDGFKGINDRLGHHIGDLLLIEVGKLFKSCLRKDDYLARLGGDEFLVIIPDISDSDSLTEMARRLVEVLARPLELEGHTVCVSVSIGIVTFPESGTGAEQLLKLADHAMYRVKHQGKNSYYTI